MSHTGFQSRSPPMNSPKIRVAKVSKMLFVKQRNNKEKNHENCQKY